MGACVCVCQKKYQNIPRLRGGGGGNYGNYIYIYLSIYIEKILHIPKQIPGTMKILPIMASSWFSGS